MSQETFIKISKTKLEEYLKNLEIIDLTDYGKGKLFIIQSILSEGEEISTTQPNTPTDEWETEFYKEINELYPYAEHIPEIKESVEIFRKLLTKAALKQK